MLLLGVNKAAVSRFHPNSIPCVCLLFNSVEGGAPGASSPLPGRSGLFACAKLQNAARDEVLPKLDSGILEKPLPLC